MGKLVVSLSLVLVLFQACSSSPSSSLRSGGIVSGANGEALAGILVRLIAIDDTGAEISEVSQQVTDTDGFFEFLSNTSFGSSLVVVAELPSGSLRAFAVGDGSSANIDPISDALVTAVIYVTETTGGRTLTDFSLEELRSLALSSRTALEADTELDLTDSSAVVSALISVVGREIADAAGGEITGQPLAGLVGPDEISAAPPFDDNQAKCAEPDVELITGDAFNFDILKDGSICNGEAVNGSVADALNDSPSLEITNDTFDNPSYPDRFPGTEGPPPPFPAIHTEDGREISFGPVLTISGDLEVTRKVYVVPEMDVVRYLEIFENVSSTEIEIDVRVVGILGLQQARLLVAQNDANRFDAESNFAAFVSGLSNSSEPTVGFVVDGAAGRDGIDVGRGPQEGLEGLDAFDYEWSNVTLPVGATKAFLHYLFVTTSDNASFVQEALQDIYEHPDMTGLSALELNSLQNFQPSIGSVVGEAGSVASFAELAFSVNDIAVSVNLMAARDGSFLAALDVVSGDSLRISGDDGTNQTITIP